MSATKAPYRHGDNVRTAWAINGDLKAAGPFLFLSTLGATAREVSRTARPTRTGHFVLWWSAGDGACPRKGILLPISSCRDAELKQALLECTPLAAEHHHPPQGRTRANIHKDINDTLAKHGVSTTVLPDSCSFVEFSHASKFAGRIFSSFDYVISVRDADPIEVLTTAPIPWKTYAEFVEWHNDGASKSTKRFRTWDCPSIALVDGSTASMTERNPENRSAIKTPALRLDRLLAVAPEVADAPIGVEFVMETHGWARLEITVASQKAVIALSSVFCPFRNIVEFHRRVSDGLLPVALEIDEEGQLTRLEAHQTADPNRVLFLAVDDYDIETVHIQAILNRRSLVQALREALITFFGERFDKNHWNDDDDFSDIIPAFRGMIHA